MNESIILQKQIDTLRARLDMIVSNIDYKLEIIELQINEVREELKVKNE